MEASKLGIGSLITTEQHRDAIHVAIAPVTANENLSPGQHVGFVVPGNTDLVGQSDNCIGIIDPFYEGRIFKDDCCWLFLYPLSVTGLRHEWEHPAFAAQETDKAASLKWMEAFAKRHYSQGDPYDGWDGPYSADQLIRFAKEYIETGYRHVQQGSESLRDSTPVAEFWRHYEVITGEKISDDARSNSPFCCTC